MIQVDIEINEGRELLREEEAATIAIDKPLPQKRTNDLIPQTCISSKSIQSHKQFTKHSPEQQPALFPSSSFRKPQKISNGDLSASYKNTDHSGIHPSPKKPKMLHSTLPMVEASTVNTELLWPNNSDQNIEFKFNNNNSEFGLGFDFLLYNIKRNTAIISQQINNLLFIE